MKKADLLAKIATLLAAADHLPDNAEIGHVDIGGGTSVVTLSNEGTFDWSGGKLVKATSYTNKEINFHGVQVQYFLPTEVCEVAL